MECCRCRLTLDISKFSENQQKRRTAGTRQCANCIAMAVQASGRRGFVALPVVCTGCKTLIPTVEMVNRDGLCAMCSDTGKPKKPIARGPSFRCVEAVHGEILSKRGQTLCIRLEGDQTVNASIDRHMNFFVSSPNSNWVGCKVVASKGLIVENEEIHGMGKFRDSRCLTSSPGECAARRRAQSKPTTQKCTCAL